MVERAKIIVTLTGYYTPDLSCEEYKSNNIATIEAAIDHDFADLVKGEIEIYELCESVDRHVEVIDAI